MHEDDDVSALPVEELRRRVYAQGADERDERWIRAAAELDRRGRASRPADGAAAETAAAAAAAAIHGDTASAETSRSTEAHAGPAEADPTADDGDADAAVPVPASRRALAWAAGALAVGLLAGGAIGAASAGSPPSTAAGGTPSPGADAPPVAAGSAPAPTASADGPALLGPDSSSDRRSRPAGPIFDGPQEDGDLPPRAVRADVDATTIRAVQASVGLYAAASNRGDRCLLVFPSGGAGVVTCASPDRVASEGLRIAWTTEFPSRNRDGSTGMITGDVEAIWSADDLITLTTPDRILAY
ncbi:hypothetical protein QFZ62_002783 [Clavibacter sp. B3I6]|uniref:hypothetical protein n=1 Tax=Clavibacter sp. B3I6 TaxID=3042268 RepID=UPI0027861D89|nr:hypothetical protein [Clavibacter sp. B3I6]MDQ0745475.1 hypothetical protein [Clavibacter sp. B3I6]